jgi:CRISPR-associated protein Cas2
MAKGWRLVCYDIRNPKRLYRVARILQGYGERVQYSIFRCHLTDRTEEQMRWKLAKVMADEDDLLVVGLCDACVERMGRRREASGWPEEPPTHRVL